MASENDNASSKLSFDGDAAVLINKGSIELDDKPQGQLDGFNFKKNKESFKESDATSTDNYLTFAKQLQACDQGDNRSLIPTLPPRLGSQGSKERDLSDDLSEDKEKEQDEHIGELNVNSMRAMGYPKLQSKKDEEVYQHIRQYNILMEDTNTAKITDEECLWENFSKDKVSFSRMSPNPNLEFKAKRDNLSGEDCNPYELPRSNEKKTRPQLNEDFSDMTEEIQTFKRRVMSNQNSTKNENIIEMKGLAGLDKLDKPRTFADQLRSVGATVTELSEPDPRSPNSLTKYTRPKNNLIRDRFSECSKNRRTNEPDIDLVEGEEEFQQEMRKPNTNRFATEEPPKNEDIDDLEKVKSPDFPARKIVGSSREFEGQKPHSLEDDIGNQFTFKDQFTTPFASPQQGEADQLAVNHFNDQVAFKEEEEEIYETQQSSSLI